MSGFSGMISFELKGGVPAGRTLMNSVKLCSLAESLGAVETMITHPATMTHAEVPVEERIARGLTDGLVRISVGIEDVDDILEDLAQALEQVSPAVGAVSGAASRS
jgi:cystathionine beta-lyase/cystathionine gamma-synthase